MEERIIKTLEKVIPNVFSVLKNQGKTHLAIDYDKEADVIYFNFDNNNQADNSEMYNDDIIIRKRDNEVIGITVLHASTL